jgi:hypothetical protein
MRIPPAPKTTNPFAVAFTFAFALAAALAFLSVILGGSRGPAFRLCPFVPLSLCPFFPLSLFSPFPRHNLRIPHSIPPYTPPMAHLAIFGMRILETLFFVGMAGSAVVVLISFVEDFRVLFQRDRPRTAEAQEYVQRADSRRIEPGAAASRA